MTHHNFSIAQNSEKVNTPPTKASSLTSSSHSSSAFTIVELLIVIVIIAILAAITIISYNGITNRTKESSLKTELSQAAKKLETEKVKTGTETYPSTLSAAGITQPSNITYTYNNGGTGVFCLQGTYENYTYFVSSASTTPAQGTCPAYIQTITTATCPSTRTMVVDARDNRTYWIQKLADGKCWMLTNLAYAGGGVNAYNDTRTMADGTADTATTFTSPKYYIPTGANPTTSPTQPSTSTNGSGQYGYLYNFCAANGGQTGNGACSSSSSTAVTTTTSVCAANWRLPTGNGGEFTALNTAINSGSASSDAGLIASPWLGQRGGYWSGGFIDQGGYGRYWSSSQSTGNDAYFLYFYSTSVDPSNGGSKYLGRSVRCVAQ